MRGDTMSEGDSRMSSTVSEAAAHAGAGSAPQTAGAWLRAARQQRGLHIAALAAMLKVPQAKLEALESDRYGDLPDATFARALAKAMCRVLKVDAAPVMGLLPRSSERELDVSRGLNQPYRERGARDEGLSLGWLQSPVLGVVALLLIAAAAIYYVPSSWLPGSDAAPAAAEAAADPALASAQPGSTEVLASAASATVPVVTAPTANAASTPTVAVAAPAASVPTVTSMAPVPQAAAAVPPPVNTAGFAPLSVKVSAESWVEVVDARGQVLLSKLMRPGDSQDLNGPPPLKVRVGNVAATTLSLRGSPVDLAAQARDNVARIELN